MKKVKITGGTYGYHNSFGRLEPKNRKSEPFTLDDAEAERLVALGVAEIIAEEVATPEFAGEKGFPGKSLSENEEGEKNGKIPCAERPKYGENTKASELREIGKSVGVKFSVGTTKEDMIAKLDEYFDACFSDSIDLTAEEPLA